MTYAFFLGRTKRSAPARGLHGNPSYKTGGKTWAVNKEMEIQRQAIHWHTQGVDITGTQWEDSDAYSEAEAGGKPFPTPCEILTPGPRAEPPFEVEMLFSAFQFEKGKDCSVFGLKIASLCASWVIMKSTPQIVELVDRIKSNTSFLSRVGTGTLTTISPDRQKEREALITLIISSALNTKDLNAFLQPFVLGDALPIYETDRMDKLIARLVPGRSGVYLVEYKGWLLGWKCGLFQMYNRILIRTSTRTGRVTDTFDTAKCKISLQDRTLTIQTSTQARKLVANDSRSVEVLRAWFISSPFSC